MGAFSIKVHKYCVEKQAKPYTAAERATTLTRVSKTKAANIEAHYRATVEERATALPRYHDKSI